MRIWTCDSEPWGQTLQGKDKMTAESRPNQQFFAEALDAISPRGEVTNATVEEFKKGLAEGNIKVTVGPSVQAWRVRRDILPTGKAHLFLPEGTTAGRIGAQAIDIMVEALAITRKLSGPHLREMDDLESALRREAYGKG